MFLHDLFIVLNTDLSTRTGLLLYILYIPYEKAKEKLKERILTQFSVPLINLISRGAEGTVNRTCIFLQDFVFVISNR